MWNSPWEITQIILEEYRLPCVFYCWNNTINSDSTYYCCLKKLYLIFHISITKSKQLSLLILLTSVNLSWSYFHRVSVQQSRLLITLVHHGVCVCDSVYTIMTGECKVYRSKKAFLLVKSEKSVIQQYNTYLQDALE